MKMTTFFILIATLQVSAKSFSQVTLAESNVSLEKVFQIIKTQTGYAFFYDESVLEYSHPVTIRVRNVPLTDALEICFKDQPLTYSIIGNTVVVKKRTNQLTKEKVSIDVRGRVVDEGAKGIGGITVTEKGTRNATATDDSGNFRLTNVQEDGVLEFSGVNVEIREIKVNGRRNLPDVSLKYKITSEKEINVTVNTGYQSLSRERSAGSFSKPDLDILKSRSGTMNVIERLEGLVPGLVVNHASGNEEILIRGLTSINSNRAPLVVVDGVPVTDINSVNPQDVADITVLKDATAASIWGAKASNGVIVIVTKKGVPNEKLQVEYDGFINFRGRPDLEYMQMMNSSQYIQTAREVFDPVSFKWSRVSSRRGSGIPPHEMILYNLNRGLITQAQADKSLDSLAAIDNSGQIQDFWYRPASLTNHTVSLSTGGKVYSLYGSLSYTNNHSNRPGEKNERFKANFRQDFRVSDGVKFYLISDLSNRVTAAQNLMAIDHRFYPYQLFRDQSGRNLAMPYVGSYSDSMLADASARSKIGLDYVPLDEVNLGFNNSNEFRSRLIGGAGIKLFDGLRFEGVYGYELGRNRITNYLDNATYSQRIQIVEFTEAPDVNSVPKYYLPVSGGKYRQNHIADRNWTVRNQLAFDKDWQSGRHQLTLLAGQEAQEQWSNNTSTTVLGYDKELLTSIHVDFATLSSDGLENPVLANNFGTSVLYLEPDPYTESEFQSRFSSFYANGAYTYQNRYSINGSWRIDKSNLFGLDKSAQNRPVWSAGAKWMIDKEAFFKDISFVNMLAVRATYGVTGNAPLPGTASSYDVLFPGTSSFYPGGVGLSISTAANRKISWESTNTINLGVDFSILQNRLSGSFDWYDKKTENLIGQMPVNFFTGYSTIVGNFGDLHNRGVELNLQSKNISSKSFSWLTALILSYNHNKITRLDYSTPISTGENLVYTEYYKGYPAFAAFAYQFAGLDSLGDPLIYLNDKSVTKTPYAPSADDVVYKGTTQPPWSGAFMNSFTYKGFSLGVNIVFNFGAVMWRDVSYHNRFQLTGRLIGGNINRLVYDRWREPGDENKTNVPSYVSNESLSESRRDVNYYSFGDLNVADASYAKIRDITLGYTLPKALISKIHSNEITFRAQVSNLMLWKANKWGLDPEFQGRVGPHGIQNLRINQGSITLGMHLSF